MDDKFFLGIILCFIVVLFDAWLWWFPGITAAFLIGRWSTS